MKIFTTTQQEHEAALSFKDNNPSMNIEVSSPDDSYAVHGWGISDVTDGNISYEIVNDLTDDDKQRFMDDIAEEFDSKLLDAGFSILNDLFKDNQVEESEHE